MDDKKLDEMYELVKENNHMLKSARRSAFIGNIMHWVWWILLVIVLPYLGWLYLQPYLQTIMDQYQAVQGTSNTIQGSMDFKNMNFTDMFKQFVGGDK